MYCANVQIYQRVCFLYIPSDPSSILFDTVWLSEYKDRFSVTQFYGLCNWLLPPRSKCGINCRDGVGYEFSHLSAIHNPSCNRRLNISQTQDKIFSLSYSEAYQRVVSCTQARHKKQIAVPWSRNKAYTCMKFLFSLFFLWRGRDGNFVVEGWRRPICYQFVGVNRFLL